jgi:hypothetical protein
MAAEGEVIIMYKINTNRYIINKINTNRHMINFSPSNNIDITTKL